MPISLPPELISVRDWLRYAVSRFNEAKLFFGQGTVNAYDEAAYLILHSLHLPIEQLEPFLEAKLTGGERVALLSVLERRISERIPAAYLTREAWLGDFRFYVDERVIIPRSYIAELLEDSLAPWVTDPEQVTTALDLCTGSGCLAILLAHAFVQAEIDAVDLSADALAVAQHNVANYDLRDRINLIRSDLFAKLADKLYDVIICNPPYVPAASMHELPPEYRHEPQLALDGGEDGLDAIRVILRDAATYLRDSGFLLVEIGHGRDAVERAFPQLQFNWLTTRSSADKVFLLSKQDLIISG